MDKKIDENSNEFYAIKEILKIDFAITVRKKRLANHLEMRKFFLIRNIVKTRLQKIYKIWVTRLKREYIFFKKYYSVTIKLLVNSTCV